MDAYIHCTCQTLDLELKTGNTLISINETLGSIKSSISIYIHTNPICYDEKIRGSFNLRKIFYRITVGRGLNESSLVNKTTERE